MRCWGGTGYSPLCPSKNAVFMGAERSAAFPFPDAHGAALQPTLHPCSAGEKINRAQAAPSAASAGCLPVLGWQDPSLGSILFCSVDPYWQSI